MTELQQVDPELSLVVGLSVGPVGWAVDVVGGSGDKSLGEHAHFGDMESSALLPDVESVEDVRVTPGQVFSRGLFAGVFVNLLVYLAPVRRHELVKSCHDGVPSRDLSPGQVPGSRPIAQL